MNRNMSPRKTYAILGVVVAIVVIAIIIGVALFLILRNHTNLSKSNIIVVEQNVSIPYVYSCYKTQKCFQIFSQVLAYTDADNLCQTFNGKIISWTKNADENAFIENFGLSYTNESSSFWVEKIYSETDDNYDYSDGKREISGIMYFVNMGGGQNVTMAAVAGGSASHQVMCEVPYSTTFSLFCPSYTFLHAKMSGESFLRNCENGWTYFERTASCYKALYYDITFRDAESYCISQCSHVISIHSFVENTFITNLISNNMSSVNKIWLGYRHYDIELHYNLYGYNQNDGQDYFWVDGSLIDYTNFCNGCALDAQNKTCSFMSIGNSNSSEFWQEVNCEERMPAFVCKKSSNLSD